MKLDVVARLDEIRQDNLLNKTVVIIDVLRSSSTILTALSIGYQQVIPVDTIGQAFHLQSADTDLAGERYSKKIEGFRFSNSPSELLTSSKTGSTLILTTTNGTKAIQKSKRGESVFIGSFLNGTACAKKVVETGRDTAIICAGSRHQFALEDGIAAGFIISEIKKLEHSLCINDMALAMELCYLHCKDNIFHTLLNTATGNRLSQIGMEQDIEICSQINTHQIVPFVQKQRIITTCP